MAVDPLCVLLLVRILLVEGKHIFSSGPWSHRHTCGSLHRFVLPGVTFSLRGDSISTNGNGRVLITDINPNGDNNEDALICTSETDTSDGQTDWFLHPTQMSINVVDRIAQVCSIALMLVFKSKETSYVELLACNK